MIKWVLLDEKLIFLAIDKIAPLLNEFSILTNVNKNF